MKRYTITLSLIAFGLSFLAGMWWQETRHFRACELAGGLRDAGNTLICVKKQNVTANPSGDQKIIADGDVINDSPIGKTKTVRGEVIGAYDNRSFDGNAGIVMKLGGGQITIDTVPSGFGDLPPVGQVDVVEIGDSIEVYGHYFKAPPFPDAYDSMDVFSEEFYLKKL